MSRTEIRDLLNRYEKAVEQDAFGLVNPNGGERRMLGEEVIARRSECVRQARDANRRFVEAIVEDLPDLLSGPSGLEPPRRPMVEFRELDHATPTLPATSYGSIAQVLLHLFRDWSAPCDHVFATTYAPAIAELRKLLPPGGDVLVPGAGLCRLAVALAAEGYRVEANEGSRLFLTVADYVLNRAPAWKLYPLAHVFSENFSHEQQYLEICVPTPSVSEASAARGASPADAAMDGPAIAMMPGDFVKTYCKGGPGYRKFNAIVTCFFLDTTTDIAELVDVLDGLLEDGGVWVNVGPLNWSNKARLKLNWDEMMAVWRGLGYEFLTNERVECDYHMRRGLKMYTESYTCAMTAAKKHRPSKV